MAGISCLLIDKAAYETQDFVLKAIRRDVINRVDISPSPFIPTAIDDSGYQTDDTTVFMGIVTHQENRQDDTSDVVHLQLLELNREGYSVGRCLHLILDQQTSLQWSSNTILKSSSSSQVCRVLILFQNIPFQCDSETGEVFFRLNMAKKPAAKIWVKHFFPTSEENRRSLPKICSIPTLEEASKFNNQVVTIYGVISAVPKVTPTETNNHVKQSFNGFCKICDPSCFDNSNDGKSFHLRIFSDTLAGYPVINKGDIIRCSNIMLWRSHMFPGQTDFKVSSAEKQIVVFPHDETREPLCVAESFKFSKEDYEQVCKLRRWYRELSHKSVNPLPTVNEYAGLDISNKNALDWDGPFFSLQDLDDSISKGLQPVQPSLESSLPIDSEGRSGRMGSPFCQVSSSGKESIHLPTLMQLSQPRQPLNDQTPSSGESATERAMLSIPSSIFKSSASRNFELIDKHLSEVDRLLDGTLEPSASRKIQDILKGLLNKTLVKDGSQIQDEVPSSSQDEANAVQDPDNLSPNFEGEDLFRDDPPNSTYWSLDFPLTDERPALSAQTTYMGETSSVYVEREKNSHPRLHDDTCSPPKKREFRAPRSKSEK